MADETRNDRRIDGRDRSALEHKLQTWGSWIEEHADYEGFPRLDNVAAARDGAGGGRGGHRVLCLDPPHWVWSIHHRILRLPDHEHAAIFVWYVPALHVEPPRQYAVYPEDLGLDDNGQPWQQWHIHEKGGARVCVTEIFLTQVQAETRKTQLIREDVKTHGRAWTASEKAERLGISEDALYQRLHRARQRLLGVLPLFARDL